MACKNARDKQHVGKYMDEEPAVPFIFNAMDTFCKSVNLVINENQVTVRSLASNPTPLAVLDEGGVK